MAPTRAIAWHVIPDDDDRGPSKTFPPCRDGDELLARVNGEALPVTVERRNGVRFVGEDGEAVEPDAIAERPAVRRETRTEADMRDRYDTVKLRLPLGYAAKLDAICEDSGMSRAEQVAGMIDGESSELARLRR